MQGWRLGFAAVFRLPRLFLSAFALIVVFDVVDRNFIMPMLQTGRFGRGTAILLAQVLATVVSAVVSIGVYRALLLGDLHDRPVWSIPAGFGRFVGWDLLAGLLAVLPLGIFMATAGKGFFVLLYLFSFYVRTRILLIFPMIAVDVPGATIGAAWQDTGGHFWQITKVYFFVYCPVLAFILIEAGAVFFFRSALVIVTTLFSHSVFFLVGGTVLRLFHMSCLAIINARLFQAFATNVGPAVR